MKSIKIKKLLAIILLLIVTITVKSQDTTKVKSLQLQNRIIEYLIPQIMQPNNDSLFQVYVDLRPKYRIASPPTGTTLVTIDSIPTTELANLYNYALSQPDGMGASLLLKAQIATARAGNTYLDRLCTALETVWSNQLINMRIAGRKILRGQ